MSWIVLDCGETINQTGKYSLSNKTHAFKVQIYFAQTGYYISEKHNIGSCYVFHPKN